MKQLGFAILTLLLASTAWGQTVQEEIEIEAASALADSDAALEEAKEMERLAAQDKKRAQREVAKMKKEIAIAKEKEKSYQARIVQAGKDRVTAVQQTKDARAKVVVIRAQTEKVRQAFEKERLKLEEVNSQRALALEQLAQTEAKSAKIQAELGQIKTNYKEAQKEMTVTQGKLGKAKSSLKMLEKKAQLSYENTEKQAASVMGSIEDQREDLNRIAKRLDQMEVEVETERATIEEQKASSASPLVVKSSKRMPSKVAKVSSHKCNVRSAPSGKGQILGKHIRGRKMRVRPHNDHWYSVIHNGETAFMGAGCFRN